MIQESRVQDQPQTTETRRPLAEHERAGFADYQPTMLARVTWGSVIAGTIAAISAQVIFATLGLAIGLSVPVSAASAEGMGIFAGIWWLVTGIVALFVGGWVAGRFCQIHDEMDAGLHGVMTWALATTLSVLFVTMFGGMLAGGAVGAMADQVSIGQQAGQTGGSGIVPQDMQQATPSTQEAEQARGTAAGAAWWSFFALLLGLVAAGIGGYVSTPRDPGSASNFDSSGRMTRGSTATT